MKESLFTAYRKIFRYVYRKIFRDAFFSPRIVDFTVWWVRRVMNPPGTYEYTLHLFLCCYILCISAQEYFEKRNHELLSIGSMYTDRCMIHVRFQRIWRDYLLLCRFIRWTNSPSGKSELQRGQFPIHLQGSGERTDFDKASQKGLCNSNLPPLK